MLASGMALAQTGAPGAPGGKNPPEPKPPLFARVIPTPTSTNGYEEWVQAADLIQNNPDVDAGTQPNATLTLKRKLLAEPAVAQALFLVRQGMAKPVGSPRQDIDYETVFPEFISFRQIARLLATEQYVAFADGRVSNAIENLDVGLAFGYRMQTDTLLSGLVGVSVDSIVMKEFARHLDQLSVHQCEQVQHLMENYLNVENPAARLLALEKGYSLKTLEAQRSSPDTLLRFLEKTTPPDDAEARADMKTIQIYLARQPAGLNLLLDDAEARIGALWDQVIQNMSLPLAQRKPFVRDRAPSPGAALFRLFTPDPAQIVDKYTSDQAELRLIAVHALIHRYKWEHNTLPASLADLHADALVTDPFTGEQIVYEMHDGAGYTLYSQGPLKRDPTTGRVASQERAPIKLTP
jgi:hypothetical protein